MKPTLIPNASIVLREKGIFYPAELYKLDGMLFAKHGRGFIKPAPGKSTSVANITWTHIFTEGSMHTITPDARNQQYLVTPQGASA